MSSGRGGASAAPRLRIPRLVHRIWLGGPEPEWLAGFAAGWRVPGWELRQWTDASVGELFPLRNQALYERAAQIAPDHVGQLRSDVVRYELLERFGGLYVDADLERLRPLEPLIADAACFAAWEEQGRWIANGLLGAIAGHPFIGRLVDELAASVAARPGARPARASGPQYLTRMQRRWRGLDLVLDQALIYPYGWREVTEHAPGQRWPGAITVHHWHNQRREQGLSCPA